MRCRTPPWPVLQLTTSAPMTPVSVQLAVALVVPSYGLLLAVAVA